VLWPAIQPGLFAGGRIQFEPELGGNNHSLTKGREGFTQELFVREWAVDFGRVEKCDATVHGVAEKRDHLLLVFGRAIRKTHAHAAEAKSRDFQISFPKFALLHCFSF
jgi:hypothetical protein